MFRAIPGMMRHYLGDDNIFKNQINSPNELDVRRVLRKILQPTPFKLAELLEEPVIGEALNQIINSSLGWKRYRRRILVPQNDLGSVHHSEVHGFLLRHVEQFLPSSCFLSRRNFNSFRLYIRLSIYYFSFSKEYLPVNLYLLNGCFDLIHLRYFISMPIGGSIPIFSLCRRFTVSFTIINLQDPPFRHHREFIMGTIFEFIIIFFWCFYSPNLFQLF